MISAAEATDLALRIADEAWEEVRRSPLVQVQADLVPGHLPQISLEESQRRSKVGAALLQRIAELKGAPLSHDAALTLRVAEFRARTWSREADRYWIAVDHQNVGQCIRREAAELTFHVEDLGIHDVACLRISSGEQYGRHRRCYSYFAS